MSVAYPRARSAGRAVVHTRVVHTRGVVHTRVVPTREVVPSR